MPDEAALVTLQECVRSDATKSVDHRGDSLTRRQYSVLIDTLDETVLHLERNCL